MEGLQTGTNDNATDNWNNKYYFKDVEHVEAPNELEERQIVKNTFEEIGYARFIVHAIEGIIFQTCLFDEYPVIFQYGIEPIGMDERLSECKIIVNLKI